METIKIEGKAAARVVDGNGDPISRLCVGCHKWTVIMYIAPSNRITKYFSGPDGNRYDSKVTMLKEFAEKLGSSQEHSFDLNSPSCKPCNW